MVLGLFFAGLVVKERDDRFCVACHLHEEKFKRFAAATSEDLTGFHRRKDAAVKCIDCHGGATPFRRVQVWTVAGFDTLKFLVGAYGEPVRMRAPLVDADCRVCHTPILKPGAQASAPASAPSSATGASAVDGAELQEEGNTQTNYHAIRDHDRVKTACVLCHTSHTTNAGEPSRFISRDTVQPICRSCHKEM